MHTPIRLLIADDSEIIRRAICVLLQAQTGIAVCGEAQDYADLLKKLGVSTADVVLMDMRMPGEGQFDPASIKGHLNGSCLLAMSVWNDEETGQPCSEPRCSEVVGPGTACFHSDSRNRRVHSTTRNNPSRLA